MVAKTLFILFLLHMCGQLKQQELDVNTAVADCHSGTICDTSVLCAICNCVLTG